MQGNKLKEIRCKRKLTLKDLSRKTNLSTSYLSRIENNERIPRVYNAIRIAHALNVSVEDIFFIDDKQEKKSFYSKIKEFFSNKEV